jgi:ABC-type polysaccharide/polyol phosphate export permease
MLDAAAGRQAVRPRRFGGPVCIVLTFSTLIITTLSITREREHGTMENLLAMPVRPIEVMVAKIVPYIAIGYVQVVLIMAISSAVFGLPVPGSLLLLLLALGLFIASNLALGFTFSTIATSQMQATQMAQFTLLPSILLSGFIFPFYDMPVWAQWTGEAFPTTHALHIVRSILLKGNGAAEILPELWPIAAFTLVVGAIAIWSYRDSQRCTQEGWRRIGTRTFGAPNNAVVTIAPLADPARDYRTAYAECISRAQPFFVEWRPPSVADEEINRLSAPPSSKGVLLPVRSGAAALLVPERCKAVAQQAGQPRRDSLGRPRLVFGQPAIDDQCREAMDEGPACQGNIAHIRFTIEEFRHLDGAPKRVETGAARFVQGWMPGFLLDHRAEHQLEKARLFARGENIGDALRSQSRSRIGRPCGRRG